MKVIVLGFYVYFNLLYMDSRVHLKKKRINH